MKHTASTPGRTNAAVVGTNPLVVAFFGADLQALARPTDEGEEPDGWVSHDGKPMAFCLYGPIPPPHAFSEGGDR